MNLRDRLMAFLHGRSVDHGLDQVKEHLTNRQLRVADRLAEMKGSTRDEVLAEAYRRADRLLSGRK